MHGPSLFGLDEKLDRDMDLYHDLDWEPRKIGEVMQMWADRFRVDIEDFDVGYYIPQAGMSARAFFMVTLKSLFSSQARSLLGRRSLTLGMLEEAMIKGKWLRDPSCFRVRHAESTRFVARAHGVPAAFLGGHRSVAIDATSRERQRAKRADAVLMTSALVSRCRSSASHRHRSEPDAVAVHRFTRFTHAMNGKYSLSRDDPRAPRAPPAPRPRPARAGARAPGAALRRYGCRPPGRALPDRRRRPLCRRQCRLPGRGR
jgi:hypothetical protein